MTWLHLQTSSALVYIVGGTVEFLNINEIAKKLYGHVANVLNNDVVTIF